LEHVWIQNHVKRQPMKIDNSHSLLKAFQSYRKAPKFRRCCLVAMTWLLSSKETAQMQQEFLAIDTDQQGTISLAELKEVILSSCITFSDLDVSQMFEAIDANHDEEIHYSEFMAAMLSTRIHLHDKLLNTTFRNFDKDLSGYITADNLHDALGKSFEGKSVESLLAEADFLKDGRVSFDEFVSFARGVPLYSQSVQLSYAPRSPDEISLDIERTHTGGSKTLSAQAQCCTLM